MVVCLSVTWLDRSWRMMTGCGKQFRLKQMGGLFKCQRYFASNDEAEKKKGSGNFSILPFRNVYHKGYRAKMVSWKCGQQKVLQPEWTESDTDFKEIKLCYLP